MAQGVIPSAVSLGARNLHCTDLDDRTVGIPRGHSAARHDSRGVSTTQQSRCLAAAAQLGTTSRAVRPADAEN